MAHSLILGISESGKTTLALNLAKEYKAQGVGVLVLDPLRNPDWHADFISSIEKEFLDVFWRSRSCMVFIDEAGEAVGKYNVAMQKTVTRGRHWGHAVHIISQRGAQLSPTLRDQCSHIFLFCSSRKDGELLAAEFNAPMLAECTALKQGEYMHVSRFGSLKYHSIFGEKNAPGNRNNRSSDNRARIACESGEKNHTGTESTVAAAGETGETAG